MEVNVDTDLQFEEAGHYGSASIIHKATYQGETVAVKKFITYPKQPRVQAGVVKSFNEELTLMKELAKYPHPNIIQLIAYQTLPTAPCLIVKYYEHSVYEILLNPFIRNIELPQVIKIATDVTEGVKHMHTLSTPIIHTDLKTDNLMVSNDGTIVIIDFGQSCFANNSKKGNTTFLGHPAWTSPEVLSGDSLFTMESDIYSLGILFWELLSREDPWPGLTEGDILPLIASGKRPEIPQHCPKEFAEIITKCWDTNVENRPTAQNLADLLAPLQRLFPQSTTSLITHCFKSFPPK